MKLNLGNIIDIIICIYLALGVYNGYKRGFVQSIFISFGFIIRAGLTYIIYKFFSNQLLAFDNTIVKIIATIRDTAIKSMPNLKVISHFLDKLILVLLIYIVVSIIVFAIFSILKNISSTNVLKMSDKLIGTLFCLAKAILIIMLIVYAFDKVSDTIPVNIKENLSSSLLLPRFYYYNIFMNIF